jgi:hypothetical protein
MSTSDTAEQFSLLLKRAFRDRVYVASVHHYARRVTLRSFSHNYGTAPTMTGCASPSVV